MEKPNIVFVLLDALRPTNLACYGYNRKTSPNIDKLAEEGTLFKNAFSTNNSTDKSLMAILSGRHLLLGEEMNIFLTKKELDSFNSSGGKLLSEILKKEGYKTHWLRELHGWQKKGFDKYIKSDKDCEKNTIINKLKNNNQIRSFMRELVHLLPKKISDKIKAKAGRENCEYVTNLALKTIEDSKKNEPFFMWVDYNSTHIPYNPKEFTGKFNANPTKNYLFKEVKHKNHKKEAAKFLRGAFNKHSTFEDIIARYDSAIYHDDYLLGKVINSLKEKKILKNTLIFVFSDHGESFNQHGIFFDHHGLYDDSTRITLIASGPKIPKGKENNSFVNHEDFVPTVLDLLNVKYNSQIFDGENMFSKKAPKYVFMEESAKMRRKAVRTMNHKYIEAPSKEEALCNSCNEIHGDTEELYDLKKDPDEKLNISKKNPKILNQMKLLLNDHIRNLKRLNEKRRLIHKFSKKS